CRTVSWLIDSAISSSTTLSAINLSDQLPQPSGAGPSLNAMTLASCSYKHEIQFTHPVQDNGKVQFRFLKDEALNSDGDRGSLPKGITLSSDGVFSGTPQESGKFRVCIATNAEDDFSIQLSREFLLEVKSK
ncbi:MAG: hypothetical protein CMJ78_10720, partial [Planctomycetaceae bacterium]|nr:hypothetical protein [Planctomycetaceae bacterium]